MTEAVIVRLLENGTYEWIRRGHGADARGHGDVDALTSAAQRQPLTLLLDGRDVRTLEASIPARSQRQAEQAAPFAIEDDVAEDLERLHVVCGAADAAGARTVAVVAQRVLQQLLAPLQAAGHRLAALVPEYLALPHRAGHWSLLRDGTRVVVRTAADRGFACEVDALEGILARLPDSRPAALDLFGEMAAPAALSDVPLHRHAVQAGTLDLMTRGLAGARVLNVLPGEFRVRQHAGRGSWLVAAAILAIALLAHVGLLYRDIRRAEQTLADLRAAQTLALQTAFPQITRLVNAEVQATQAVAELRSTHRRLPSALEMIHHVGQAMRAEGVQGLTLENLNYADGVLGVRLRAPDIATLERYSEALKTAAAVDVVAVEAHADGVSGNLRLQPRAGDGL